MLRVGAGEMGGLCVHSPHVCLSDLMCAYASLCPQAPTVASKADVAADKAAFCELISEFGGIYYGPKTDPAKRKEAEEPISHRVSELCTLHASCCCLSTLKHDPAAPGCLSHLCAPLLWIVMHSAVRSSDVPVPSASPTAPTTVRPRHICHSHVIPSPHLGLAAFSPPAFLPWPRSDYLCPLCLC
jgi:hypothetical protein